MPYEADSALSAAGEDSEGSKNDSKVKLNVPLRSENKSLSGQLWIAKSLSTRTYIRLKGKLIQ